MARASYQNLSHISFGSPRKAKVIKKTKPKPKSPDGSKVEHPTVTPTIVSSAAGAAIPHTPKPILRLKY